MELRGFFATVFAFLFTVEVYSRPFISFDSVKLTVSGCTNGGFYMRINTINCENKNSRMECPAMADGETNSSPSTLFTLERNTSIARLNKLRCISFNNTYSLMVQGNNVSFVNVSCEKGGNNVWFKFKKLPDDSGSYLGFFIPGSTMCLTRSCNGTLSVEKVNSTTDRKCFFRQRIIR
ncbi:unnamed protein product [Porites lobata]|uniref:Uncharacterized protein n=1 Tax=Porites lobata TaxID=104759 RepID=A0ABN8R2C6_9CNID|nr:unnamed protein product [Porites lobata]